MRARVTLAVAAVTALALILGSAGLVGAMRERMVVTAEQEAERTADQLLRQLEGAITAESPDGTVTVTVTPGDGAPEQGGIVSRRSADGEFRVQTRVDLSAVDSAMGVLLVVLAPGITLIVALVALLTWWAVGRALRPVEAIRREVADIAAHDLHRRVPVPSARDEIANLATTMNATLDRLDRAVTRLRTFTADASHELRSPLTTLRARLELGRAGRAEGGWDAVATEALWDVDQLERLASDLLLLARLDSEPRPGRDMVDLAELARAEATRPPGTPVDVDAPAAVRVPGDRAQLTRLIRNLVDNARRHAGSSITIRVAEQDGTALLEVADDGPGIPEGRHESIFERFTRLDDARTRDQAGTGLGLAIARRIADAHNATLTSEPTTAGALFRLRIQR